MEARILGHEHAAPNDGSSFCRAQVVAKDFLNVVTVSFRVLYVLAILEIGTRKILHFNVTAHPTAEWTLQQFLAAIPCEHDNRFFIVDRDGKFSADLRRSVRAMGVRWLRTPRRAPQANSYCERRCCTARSKSLTSLMPVAESPGAVRIGHPERGHLVEYLAPNSVFNSLPRQRSCSHLRPDDRFVTIDRVLHHASLGEA